MHCFIYAAKHPYIRKPQAQLELLSFLLYGFCLEIFAVRSGFYTYGHFALELWETPLVIALGWAVIGFSAMWFSDSLDLSNWVKPFFDALFALLIDLSMDSIAIRDSHSIGGENLAMWNWGIALDHEWFGVPYANLIGWWAIVFLMSSSLRLGRYFATWHNKKWFSLSYPLIAAFAALALFILLLTSFADAFGSSLLILLISLSLIIVSFDFKGCLKSFSWQKDAPVFIVPFAFHSFFLALLLARNMQQTTPYLLLIALFSFLIHESMIYKRSKA